MGVKSSNAAKFISLSRLPVLEIIGYMIFELKSYVRYFFLVEHFSHFGPVYVSSTFTDS